MLQTIVGIACEREIPDSVDDDVRDERGNGGCDEPEADTAPADLRNDL